jgi:membrane protease YdiL (CAAX protease family)
MIKSHKAILLEFFLLCVALPTLIWTMDLGRHMFGFLWGAAIYTSFIWLRIAYTGVVWSQLSHKKNKFWASFKEEWNWAAVTWDNMRPILVRWIIGTTIICAFTAWYAPDRLFIIPREMPQIIPFLVLAYPILSALPQEFIFCSFFMKRYGHLFRHDWLKILVSAIVFGYAHMLFINWVAPVFSFFGGLVFAYTYLKTRSLSLVTIEHSLYGNSIFLAGIGYYFYSGGIGQ